MPKRDIIVSLVIGEVSAWLMLLISQNLAAKIPVWWLLPLIFPLLCAGGMLAALFFEKKLKILYQFAKFVLVGGLNVLVDLGVLNLLIYLSGVSAGLGYSVFKGLSFLVATVNSFFWNQKWVFSQNQNGLLLRSSRPTEETAKFGQFLVVSAIGLAVNVSVASLAVNLVGPQFGLTAKIWATLGALMGSVVGLFWNFLGYKFIVFK